MVYQPQHTRTGTVELLPSGITLVRIDPQVEQTLDDARENIATAIRVGSPWMRPLLIDVRNAKPPVAEVRHYYGGAQAREKFLAMCLLVDATPLGRMMGNIYFRVAKLGIPTRLETNESAALAWLSAFFEQRSPA